MVESNIFLPLYFHTQMLNPPICLVNTDAYANVVVSYAAPQQLCLRPHQQLTDCCGH